MDKKTLGRPSRKRQRLFNVYKLLRCAMIREDVEEMLKRNPRFRDRTLEDTDVNIQEAIYDMVEAMLVLDPPDISRAEPLRR